MPRLLLLFLVAVFPLHGVVRAESVAFTEINAELQVVWEDAERALVEKRFGDLSTQVAHLITLRSIQGSAGYELLAESFLSVAGQSKSGMTTEERQFLCRQATAIAPLSAAVLFQSFALCGEEILNHRSVGEIFEILISDPRAVGKAFVHSVPAFLFAMTAALVIASFLTILIHFALLVRLIEAPLPRPLRRIAGRPLLLILLVGPLPAGPFVTLLVWNTLFTLIRVPRTRLPLYTGLAFFAWAALVPAREILRVELARPETQLQIRAWIGDDSPEMVGALGILMKERPSSTILPHLTAQALRRARLYEESARALALASEHSPSAWQPFAELALVQLAKKDLTAAEDALNEAQSLGADGAAFAYLASRIAFEKLDTEGSRDWFKRARELDDSRVEHWRAEELALSGKSFPALMSFQPPIHELVSDLLPYQSFATVALSSGVTAALTGVGTSALLMMAAGLTLLALLRRQPGRFHPRPDERSLGWLLLQFVPGARSVRYGSGGLSFAATTLIVLFALPLVGFPMAIVEVWNESPGVLAFYASLVVLFAFMTIYTEWLEREEENEYR